jgi:hypothetical protein
LTVAFQSRRRIIAFLAMLIVLVGAFILLRPRLWVKNKTAKVIVDGRLSEDVKLFHGSDGRLLFILKSDPTGAYIYDKEAALSEVWRCEQDGYPSFIFLKVIAVSRRIHSSGCAMTGNGDVMWNPHRDNQSLSFEWHDLEWHDHHYVISWQAAPR